MPQMVSGAVGNLALCLHTKEAIPTPEWAHFMDILRTIDPAQVRVLVFTDGGGPNAAQRKQFHDYTGAAKPSIAIVTDSSLIGALLGVFSMFQPRVARFSPRQVREALAHVGLGATDGRPALDEAHRMARRLDGGAPAALLPATTTSLSPP